MLILLRQLLLSVIYLFIVYIIAYVSKDCPVIGITAIISFSIAIIFAYIIFVTIEEPKYFKD